jgi:hypothetical protein
MLFKEKRYLWAEIHLDSKNFVGEPIWLFDDTQISSSRYLLWCCLLEFQSYKYEMILSGTMAILT